MAWGDLGAVLLSCLRDLEHGDDFLKDEESIRPLQVFRAELVRRRARRSRFRSRDEEGRGCSGATELFDLLLTLRRRLARTMNARLLAGITELRGLHPRAATVVELHYSGGMSLLEIATKLRISRRGVECIHRRALRWMRAWMKG